jgi:hypothetical protein
MSSTLSLLMSYVYIYIYIYIDSDSDSDLVISIYPARITIVLMDIETVILT